MERKKKGKKTLKKNVFRCKKGREQKIIIIKDILLFYLYKFIYYTVINYDNIKVISQTIQIFLRFGGKVFL